MTISFTLLNVNLLLRFAELERMNNKFLYHPFDAPMHFFPEKKKTNR